MDLLESLTPKFSWGERIETRWRIYPKHAQGKNQALAVKKGKGVVGVLRMAKNGRRL